MPRLRIPHVPSFRDVNQLRLGLVAILVIGGLVTGRVRVRRPRLSRPTATRSRPCSPTPAASARATTCGWPACRVGEVTGIHPDFDAGQVIVSLRGRRGHRPRSGDARRDRGRHAPRRLLPPPQRPGRGAVTSSASRRTTPGAASRSSAPARPISLIGALSDTTTQVQAIDIDAVNDGAGATLAGATRPQRRRRADPDRQPHHRRRRHLRARRRAARPRRQRPATSRTCWPTATTEIVHARRRRRRAPRALSQRRDELATILGSGSDAVVTLTDTIKEHRGAIDPLLADAHVLLDGVERNTGAINTSLAVRRPAVHAPRRRPVAGRRRLRRGRRGLRRHRRPARGAPRHPHSRRCAMRRRHLAAPSVAGALLRRGCSSAPGAAAIPLAGCGGGGGGLPPHRQVREHRRPLPERRRAA